MISCQFCNKEFSNKGNLNFHIKNAIYCLKLRNKTKEIKEDLSCKYCKKKYSRIDYFKKHLDICKTKIILENEKMKQNMSKLQKEKEEILYERIKDLKDCNTKLAEVAKTPITINNNNTNDNSVKKVDNKVLMMLEPSDMMKDKEKIRKIFQEKFKTSHLLGGVKGVAQFSLDHIIKTDDGKLRYVCTDPSRSIFIYMNEDGTISKDIECVDFLNLIYEPVNQECKRLYHNIENDYQTLKYDLDESLDNNELTRIDDEYQDQVDILNNHKERKDIAFKKVYEVQNIQNENKGKFIKALSIPLHNSIKK